MNAIVTITAFSVVVPFAVGLFYYKKTPAELVPIVMLCGVWLAAEIYCYYLRMQGKSNAHVSYILTPIEIFLYTSFYFRIAGSSRLSDRIGWAISAAGLIITITEYFLLSKQFNSISLAIEFALIAFMSVYTYLGTNRYPLLNLTILFYALASFPYFFTYEWLRVNNLSLLMLLAGIYSYTHSVCYILMALILWKRSTSFVAPLSSR